MASNLTGQVRNIAEAQTIAVANGDLSKKITVDVWGEIFQLKEAINTMVYQPPVLRVRSDPSGSRRSERRENSAGKRLCRELPGRGRI